MALDVNVPSHVNTTYVATNTNIEYEVSYNYNKVDAEDGSYCDITLVTSWKSEYTNDNFIVYSTKTYRVTSDNLDTYENEIETIRAAQQTECEEYLNTLNGNIDLPTDYEGVYVKNADTVGGVENYGTIYFYKVKFTQEYGETDNIIKYDITYGSTSDTCDQEYFSNSATFDVDNYKDVFASLVTEAAGKVEELKGYIDSLEDPKTPSQIKPTDIQIVTDYGLDTNYGTDLTSSTYTVNIDNYDTYRDTVVEIANTQEATITDQATYKMLNMDLPGVATNTNYVAANGVTYQYKVTATNGNTSLTERNIVYTTTWGVDNYDNTWATKHTLKLTTSNYNTANITTTNRTTQETATKNYLNTLIGTFSAPNAVTETYTDAPSGITYYIKTTFTGSNTDVSATSGTLAATTTWGTTSGVYDHTFTDDNVNNIDVTPSNFANRNTLIAEIGTNQRINLKNYLDTLIGATDIPSDKTTTFDTTSGQTFYVKTSFNGEKSTETETLIKYTTVYGLSTSYGNTLSSDVEFLVTPDNYSTWEGEIATAVAAEQEKVKNLDSYKMLNVALPDVETNTEYEATNGNIYQYKVTATNGNATLSERNIVYTSTWGIGNFDNTWARKHTLTLTTSNYNTADITTTNRTTQVNNTEAYLNTLIGIYSAPNAITETYIDAPSGLAYYIKTTFSGSNSSITATSGTLSATTSWGTAKGVYDHSFTDDNVNSITVDPENFAAKDGLIGEVGATQRTNLKQYLDTLIGVVNTPSDITNVFNTASGQTFYVKTSATGSNDDILATSCTIKYTTVYGLTDSYGNTLSTDEEFVITPSNYKNWTDSYATAVAVEQAKIKDSSAYKLYNVTPLTDFEGVHIKNATTVGNVENYGIIYHYKVSFIQSYNDNDYTVRYDIKYGATEDTCDQTFYSNTFTFDSDNAETTEDLVEEVQTKLDELKAYIDNLSKPETPELEVKPTSIQILTEYGLDTEYDYALEPSTHLVKDDNYTSYHNTIVELTKAQEEKVRDTDLYKLYNVIQPTNIFKVVVKGGDGDTFTYDGVIYKVGIIYKYEVIFHQGATTGSTNKIEYQINYGSAKAYDLEFDHGSVTFNINNYSTAIDTLLQEVQDKLVELEKYIEDVVIPDTEYKPVKEATVEIDSDYGLSDDYNKSLGTSSVTINGSNYANYNDLIINKMNEQESNINNTELFRMLDMTLPSPIVKHYTPSISGIKFNYRITPTFYEVSESEVIFKCVTTWGYNDNYDNEYTDKDITVAIPAQATAYNKITNAMNEIENDLRQQLDTYLPIYPVIDDYTQKIKTASGVQIWVKTSGYVVEEGLTQKYTIKFTTTYDTNDEYRWTYSTDQIFEVTASTFSNWYSRYAARVNEEQLKIKDLDVYKMLNLSIPNQINRSCTIKGINYTYKIVPTQGGADFNTNTVNYTVYWSEGSVNNIFTTKNIVFDQSNYVNATSIFSNTFNMEEGALMDYLDSLTFKHSETVKLVTDYGLDTNYGSALSTITKEINAEGYKTYAEDLVNATINEQEGVKRTMAYNILNIEKPSNISNNKVAANGLRYYYRFRYDQSTTTLDTNKINYVVEYGLSNNYGSTYITGSFDFDDNNYASAAATMENTANQKIADLLKFLDNIIGSVTLPNTINNSWKTSSGKTMNVRTRFEIASSTPNSEVSSEKDSMTVRYITEYGLDNNYATSWSNKTFTITPATYSGYSNDLVSLATIEQRALQDSDIMKMLNIQRPNNIEDSMIATNGITYTYAAKFVQDTTTLDSNKIVIVLWYGTSSNPNIVYTQKVKEFTPSNSGNATADLATAANAEIEVLKTFLNKYVPSDDIVVPSVETYVYTSKCGKKFYLKTTFTKGEYNDSMCAIRYITVWGFSNTYGYTYSDKTHIIDAEGYRTYADTLIKLAHKEFENCEQERFGIWDVSLPNNSNETYTTKGSDLYYIKSTFEYYTSDNQTNTVKYIITYGTSLATNTANLWSENVYDITNNNMTDATRVLRNLANEEIIKLEEFLDIPNVELPNDTVIPYTVNGFEYDLRVIHTKGNKGNIVITTSKIDGVIFGNPTTTTFLSQRNVEETLRNIVDDRVNAMKDLCNLSPANKAESHNVGDCQFSIETEFVKNLGVTQASCITKLDGVEYKRTLVNINANSIEASLQNMVSTGETNATALKGVLVNMPITNTSTHISGGFNYNVTINYTKAEHSNVVHYVVACDGSVYDSNDYLLDATVLTNSISDLIATVNAKASELKRKLTNASPGNSSENLTYKGFQYLVGVEYVKPATSKNASVRIMIDNVMFNEFTKLVDQSTIDNDMIVLVAKGDEIRTSLLNLINKSPSNKSYIHQVNGFNYTVATEYEKNAGNQNVTIKTLLDGRVYKNITRSIESDNIATNLNECILNASNNELELTKILNTSPADSNRSEYAVDDIKYYVGATFTKVSTNNVVAVAITLDNEPVETYSENILAETVAEDIERIKVGAQTRVQALKENLIGLKNTTIDYNKNGFNFKLKVEFSKDLENRTLTINTKVDNVLYGTPYTATFNKDNIEDYKVKANNLLENIKSVLNNAPEDISNEFAVNGFNFNVGIAYEKAAENATVQIFTVLDGVKFDDPAVVNFNMDNIGLVSEKGLAQLAILKERLKSVPANYSNTFTVGGLEFRISTNFNKDANSNIVRITTAVDGENYGTTATKVFDINDISSISLETADREEEIKDILRGAPEDSAEVFTIRRLNFNIQKVYQKSAGSKLVTSMVKMDGNQYEETHQEEYNIANLSALTDYNDALVASLKNKLTNSIPNDIHTTYTRNQFTFVVDIYFTKSVNSDVINVEYYIDSADLANTLHG